MTETTSAPGRVTWEGECAHKGCSLRVKARRVPRDQIPLDTDPEPAPVDTRRDVKEVSYDVPPAKREQRPDGDGGDRDTDPGRGPALPTGERERDTGTGDTPDGPDRPGPDRPDGERVAVREHTRARRPRPRRRRPWAGFRFRAPFDP